MEFANLVNERVSVRKYKKDPVEKEKVDALLKVLATAPSSANRQEWKYVVVSDEEILKKLTVAAESRPPISEAPLVFCIISTENKNVNDGGLNKGTIDGAIASTYLHLAACDIGLGSCWVGSFNQKLAAEAISLPEGYCIISLFAIGYPDETPNQRPRKDISDLVVYNHF
jgi:Nitroreductase